MRGSSPRMTTGKRHGRAGMIADRTKEDAGPQRERVLRILLPIAVLTALVLVWYAVVQVYAIPPYVLPGPLLVLSTLVSDWAVLWGSLLVTLTTTLEGFLLAAFGGIALAVLFNQSRLIEYSLYPYAGILPGGAPAAVFSRPLLSTF